MFVSENIFLKKNLEKKIANIFQVDITSSDLNEFWIGQKILEAESLLLKLVPFIAPPPTRSLETIQKQSQSERKATI